MRWPWSKLHQIEASMSALVHASELQDRRIKGLNDEVDRLTKDLGRAKEVVDRRLDAIESTINTTIGRAAPRKRQRKSLGKTATNA